MGLDRSQTTNLEKSIKKYLTDEISSDSVTVLIENTERSPEVRLEEFNDNWNLPVIQVEEESLQAPKPFVGQTRVVKTRLVIIDLYCNNGYERKNLAEYITDKLVPGFDYVEYSNNLANPDSPTEVVNGHVSVTFIGNTKLNFGNNANSIDKYRHRITINCEIGNS